jgi:TM2 domain-containing membrane protein YozV
MQLACRRCNGTFSAAGPQPTPCPACGSVEVVPVPLARSPKAATTEQPMRAFSAPLSQLGSDPSAPEASIGTQQTLPLAPQPQAPLVHYTPNTPNAMMHSPSYPAPMPQQPPQQQQQHQQQWGPSPYPPQAYPQPYPQHAPVHVVIQNHIGPVPYQAAPYAMAPYARRKDAGVATLLSFFLPGAGQLYNGQTGKGLAFLLITLFINFPLMFIGVGFLTGLITWIWGMIDAHSSAERINRGEIVV